MIILLIAVVIILAAIELIFKPRFNYTREGYILLFYNGIENRNYLTLFRI